jgi:succinoglycan biosynthesis protein ExoA
VAEDEAVPFATVALPVRNEARTIDACLNALQRQDYPHDRFEILVLDGASTDGTVGIVERFAASSDIPVRLIANPSRTTPAALNIALAEARGERFIRVDGHSKPEPTYLRRCVAGNDDHDADLAGGWVRAVGSNRIGRAVAAAFASPVSMGNPGSWNAPPAALEVESVPCGSYRAGALRAIGGFDEGQLANQDYEANYRLRAAGGRVVLLPDVHFDYEPRDRLSRLARQFFRYGWFKARTMAKHPRATRPRHLVPAAALVAAAALIVASPFWSPAFFTLVGAVLVYMAALVAAALRGGRERLLLPAVFATMHVAWATGNLFGLVRWLPAARGLRQAPRPAHGLPARSR